MRLPAATAGLVPLTKAPVYLVSMADHHINIDKDTKRITSHAWPDVGMPI